MISSASDRQVLLTWLRDREREMVDLLDRLARMESPSLDPASQNPVFALLAAELVELGFLVRRLPREASGQAPASGHGMGDHLYARPAVRVRGAPSQLLVGHMDTVWPVGTLSVMPLRQEGNVFSGPGTYDMKAGLVQMLFAFRALRAHEISLKVLPLVFINSDEEIGSHDSDRWLRLLSRCSSRAFILEPSYGAGGALKTGRKGVGHFTVTVQGTAAHAGIDPERGASAVLELSHQIQRLFDLNDRERGITVNVGMIDGGLRPNMVAPKATAEIDVRVPTMVDAQQVEAEIRGLTPIIEGTTIVVGGGFNRPPMEETAQNMALWGDAKRLAGELGLELDRAIVGGGSDGNRTSQYVPTLDGLGGVGDGAHAAHEHVITSYMPERAALLVALLTLP